MKLFRRKPPKIKTEDDYFQGSQLLDLSHISVPSYPIYSTYYGQPIASLASGTYDEVQLYTWIPSSGTVYGFDQNFDVTVRDKTFRSDIMICTYCKSKILIATEFKKDMVTSLSCPNCGGNLE